MNISEIVCFFLFLHTLGKFQQVFFFFSSWQKCIDKLLTFLFLAFSFFFFSPFLALILPLYWTHTNSIISFFNVLVVGGGGDVVVSDDRDNNNKKNERKRVFVCMCVYMCERKRKRDKNRCIDFNSSFVYFLSHYFVFFSSILSSCCLL